MVTRKITNGTLIGFDPRLAIRQVCTLQMGSAVYGTVKSG